MIFPEYILIIKHWSIVPYRRVLWRGLMIDDDHSTRNDLMTEDMMTIDDDYSTSISTYFKTIDLHVVGIPSLFPWQF